MLCRRIRSGSDNHDVYFVIEGRVRVVNCWQVGREISFQDLEAGECFGELSAIDQRPRSASVVALVDTLLASLPSRTFLDLLVKYPDVALALMSGAREGLPIKIDLRHPLSAETTPV